MYSYLYEWNSSQINIVFSICRISSIVVPVGCASRLGTHSALAIAQAIERHTSFVLLFLTLHLPHEQEHAEKDNDSAQATAEHTVEEGTGSYFHTDQPTRVWILCAAKT